ncbi:hypothetical protein Tco_1260157 [Tanacetum coccineum]
MVYQKFLKEFWSTVVAFYPFPSTDEPEKCLLNVFLIKFSVLNRQRPLTLDFKTFCSSTGLDYNNGKYVDHPTPKAVKKELGKIAINPSYLDKTPVLKNSFPVTWRILFTFVIQVLGGNYSSTEQVNSIQQLISFSLTTGTKVDIGEIIYSDLATKLLNKSRLKYDSNPRFISCALQVLLGSDYTQDENFGSLIPILSNLNFTKDPSKVTDIELTAHMIAVNNQKDSVSPPPLAAKPKKGKPQTVTPTIPKSQGQEHSLRRAKGLSTVPDPQDLKRDIQLASMGLPSTLNEGTRTSQPLPEGNVTHPKDSRGNIQPLDRDLTFMTSDKGTAKTAPHPEGSLGDKDSEGNIPPADMEPINPTVADPSGTVLNVRAILLSEDETEESEEDVLGAGEEMDDKPQADDIAETHL